MNHRKDVNMEKTKCPFSSEAVFRRKLNSYLDYCSGGDESGAKKRIANTAGFCAYCNITSGELMALKSAYPRQFDIMQSHLVDAAVNNKLLNSGPMMDYLINSINLFGECDESPRFRVDGDFEGDSL